MKYGTVSEQISIEEEAQEASINKYINSFYKDMNNGNIADTAEGNVFIKLGFDNIVKKIQEYIDTKTTGTRTKDKNELLTLCDDPKVLAYVTINTMLRFVVNKNNRPTLISIANGVVRSLYKEQGVQLLKDNDPKMFKYMDSQYRRASKARKASLMQTHIDNLKDNVDASSGFAARESKAEFLRIGTTLVDCVINSGVNLFTKGKLYTKGSGYTYIVSMTQEGREVLEVAHSEVLRRLTFTAPPMVVPPLPWTNNYDGGLHTKRNPIMKMRTPEGFKELKSHRLEKVYPVLNKLQNTKWRLNTFVVDTITTIFENNMIDPRSPRRLRRLYGGLPTNDIYNPDEIIVKEKYGQVDEDGMFKNKSDFVRWRRDIESVTISLDGEMGRRLKLISAIGEANLYKDYAELYFSYTLDSRGRVYTQQAVITPQGSAEIKAMLEFADGTHLTPQGEYWFKIHTANVFGKDKENFDERIHWFDTNILSIRNVGTDPLGRLGEWAYSDSPFEYLAACKAWVDHEAGLPVYVPIQLDATNSGVQIYSGLLGDLEGAKTVNVINDYHEVEVSDDYVLKDGEEWVEGYENTKHVLRAGRADVYGIVADKVNKALVSGNYPKIFEVTTSDGLLKRQLTNIEANSIAGKITRSIVKHNVMTVPYSVSKRGMSDQLWNIIDDAKLQEKEWWEGDPWVVNKLLTDLNHEAIYDTIPGARVGQDYLVELAIQCNDGDGMKYLTPIYDIPVVQKRPKSKLNRVDTVLGTLSILNWVPNSLDKMAQKNGSAPNYIHSIDSTLLLRVIETMSCNIGVIHDCFLCHANYGDELQSKFKEAYIEIMQMKPLELIGKQLDPDGNIEVPYIGTMDLDEVRNAQYIIS